ncbi:MAG TPA: hypothetical protein VK565_04755, partial [Gemmatimonadaceae bacterium]|nr:hypothetical protein [Gemmatimonadaceae bacterium]
AQKGACRDNYAFCSEASSFQRFDSKDATLTQVEHQSCDGALHRLQICLLFKERPDCPSVEAAVTLCARSPNRRTFAAIEHTELNHGEIGSSSHDSSKRIHLAHDRAFGYSADRWIARHLPDCFERARNQACASAQASSSDGCFSAGVAAANDYNVEVRFKLL